MFRLLLILVLFSFLQGTERQSERDKMVRTQIQRKGIRHPDIVRAMKKVERHRLVPEDQRANAYEDYPLPIGFGQTISQPYIVAYMTACIVPQECRKVLEIGTGSGYQAAVLAEIVDSVFTVEIVRELGERARKNLSQMGYRNIRIKIGDGYEGWAEHAPFDAIVVTAAAEYVPPPLLRQLRDGGRMIIPVGSPYMVQQLVLVEKKGKKVKSWNMMPVRFVPFTRTQ